jgi:glycosyltransferase involved in cell wall biosynthesis
VSPDTSVLSGPRVSVVVPCYNMERHLAETIESVRAQTLTAWEIVVVDDGSQDRSSEIAARYGRTDPRVRLVRQENRGIAAARNAGYRRISPRSDYVMWLDADDLLERTALEILSTYLDEHPPVGLVFSDRSHVDESGCFVRTEWKIDRIGPGRVWPRHLPGSQHNTPFDTLFAQDGVTNPSSSLVRRSIYDATPGYDESLGPFEDWDLVLRIALESEVHFIPEKLTRYRIRAGSATSDLSAGRDAMRRLYRIWAEHDGVPSEQVPMVLAATRFREGQAVPAQWIGWGNDSLRRGSIVGAARCYAIALKSIVSYLGKWAVGGYR